MACARSALERPARRAARTCSATWRSPSCARRSITIADWADRVIDQARRRVIDGEQVPNAEKIYSIFEPHTDLIKRGKVRTPMEFGHKVFLAESAQGLITQYQVLEGKSADEQHVGASLQRHKKAFGRAPELYSADRGFFSERNLTRARSSGVKVVCIPQSGGKRTPEREACEKSADLQARTALQGRHRGTHLRAVPRSRHEALSGRRQRALRVVGRRRRARQQPDEHRRLAHETTPLADGKQFDRHSIGRRARIKAVAPQRVSCCNPLLHPRLAGKMTCAGSQMPTLPATLVPSLSA